MQMLTSRHNTISIYLLTETLLIFLFLSFLSLQVYFNVQSPYNWFLYALILLFQGLWLDRIYITGHEATHRKLFPKNHLLNDIAGVLILTPLLVPLQIYRKIHFFHHGFNRKDHHTSVLDVFVSKKKITPGVRIKYYALWFAGVFLGGYFIHSIASIIIFLFLPTRLAARISPAFKSWTFRDRLWSWFQFGLGITFHLLVYNWLGWKGWLIVAGFPFLVFAWIWSMLVYIFHYDTT